MTIAQPLGMHHVTAIATDPQRNVDFYREVLGLRLVKQTVNYDAPDTYHLYYGDEAGHPGTILTFFPWPHAPRGRRGTGQATTTAFSVPEGSLGYWQQRLRARGVEIIEQATRESDDVLALADPDGLRLELVAHPGDRRAGWPDGPVPVEHAVRGLFGVVLTEGAMEGTDAMLRERLGFQVVEEVGGRTRYGVGDAAPGRVVDVVADPRGQQSLTAAGTVHHIAWRAPDRDIQRAWREALVEAGVTVTPIIDRQYFESIYFREPGGVLLEIATDPPGFTRDEPLLELGRRLRLPPWLEPRREAIEALLPPLKLGELGDDAGDSPAGETDFTQ
jgi:glyoxalase family protein